MSRWKFCFGINLFSSFHKLNFCIDYFFLPLLRLPVCFFFNTFFRNWNRWPCNNPIGGVVVTFIPENLKIAPVGGPPIFCKFSKVTGSLRCPLQCHPSSRGQIHRGFSKIDSHQGDLNSRPLGYKASALTAKLWRQVNISEIKKYLELQYRRYLY